MRRLFVTALLIGTASLALAQTKEPIALRDIGSFHLGGRFVDISGKPTREVSIGGATQTLNPNGTYLVEQMYVQYLLPQNRKGKVPLLMWHGGGFTGVTYEIDTRWPRRLAQHVCAQGLGQLRVGRGRARPRRLGDAGSVRRRSCVP